MFIEGWMDEEDVVYIHSGILLNHENNEILPLATLWMKLEDIMLSEISQRKTKLYDFTHMWNLKKQMNK